MEDSGIVPHRSRDVPELRWLDPARVEGWDNLLGAHPDATVFHTQEWAKVLTETYGYQPLYLAAFDAQRICALLPVFELRSWLKGRRGVSLPFTDQCAPLLSPAFDLGSLFKPALELGAGKGWKSLELRGAPLEAAPPSISFYQHDLDLAGSEAGLFDGCDAAMRRSIRKAQRAKLEVECHSTLESVDSYYKLHETTRRKHGIPPQPIAFFRNIQRFVIAGGNGTVLLARLNNVPVAGAIFLHFGKHSVYKFGASDATAQELRANNLLLWLGILRMKELGALTLSFGRTSLHQEGLRRFKRSFGACETLLRYTKYDYRTSSFAEREEDRSSGWHTRFFRLCPKPLSRMIGRMLYPHVG